VIGGKSPLRAAHHLGVECVYVERPARLSAAKVAMADHVLATDFTNVDELCRLMRAWHEVRPFDAVISMTEAGLMPAAMLARSLGVTGTPVETVALLRDKAAMRRRLAGSALEIPSASGCTVADVVDFATRHGYPCIVKPLAGSGSSGVNLVRSAQEASGAVRRLTGLGESAFLIEPYLAGREFSVESLSFAGEHMVVAITEKFVGPSFVEVGHLVPARLGPAEAGEVARAAIALLDAVGLRDGAAHTEVVCTADGARVIESHSRTGGDRINELVRIAYGVDMIAAAVEWTLYRRRPQPPGVPRSAAAIRFLTPAPGLVQRIDGVDALTHHPAVVEVEVTVAVGDRIGRLESSPDRAGHVLVHGSTPDEAMVLAERLAAGIVIDTDDPSGPGGADRPGRSGGADATASTSMTALSGGAPWA
jgi:biotin carboxylase